VTKTTSISQATPKRWETFEFSGLFEKLWKAGFSQLTKTERLGAEGRVKEEAE